MSRRMELLIGHVPGVASTATKETQRESYNFAKSLLPCHKDRFSAGIKQRGINKSVHSRPGDVIRASKIIIQLLLYNAAKNAIANEVATLPLHYTSEGILVLLYVLILTVASFGNPLRHFHRVFFFYCIRRLVNARHTWSQDR